MFTFLFPARSRFPSLCVLVFAFLVPAGSACAGGELPMNTVFKGRATFDRLVAQAQRENWRALAVGDRVVRAGAALMGTPYKGFTLEIDDRIEAPSANLEGVDCWTFFEISLGFARMLRAKDGPYAPADLLHMIELDRYRHGQCTGEYLSRLHFLEELFADNEKRGLVTNITPRLPGAERMEHRDIHEMTTMWKHYRYLRSNPSLLPEMAQIQERVSDLPVYHVPKSRVAAAEPYLRNGDIIAVTSRDTAGYTSHVGLAYRDATGVLRFMHASSRYRKVVLDDELSSYLADKSDDAGIIVARPEDVPARGIAER